MGWYGNSYVICPNCKQNKACEIYRNSCLESYYLACTNCGLCLFAPEKQWVVQNSYIDQSIIGKDQEELMPDQFINTEKNENVIKEGTAL